MSMGVSETVYVHVCIYNYVCAMMCVYKQVYINTSVRVFTPLQLAGIDQDFSGHHALCAGFAITLEISGHRGWSIYF